MTGTLFNAPRYIPVNNAGIPRGGAKLYFYQAGTATPVTVYQSAALSGGASHTSPVVATSSGEFPAIYVDPSTGYDLKVVLLSAADVQIWAEDDIPVAPEPIHRITAAEIAAAVTPTNYGYEPGNVLRYGTNTTPGTTDMTAALAAAALVGGEINLGGQICAVDKFTLAVAGTRLVGPGTLKARAVQSPVHLLTVAADGVEIRGVKFDGNSHANNLIYASGRDDLVIEDCEFYAGGVQGHVFIIGCARPVIRNNISRNSTGTGRGFWIGNYTAGSGDLCTDIVVTGNRVFSNGATGIVCSATGGVVSDNIVYSNAGSGIIFGGANSVVSSSLTISNNRCYDHTFHGIQCDSSTANDRATYITITGNVCELNDGSGVYAARLADSVITGNVCRDNNHDASGSGFGILIEESARIAVFGNLCLDTRAGASRTQGAGVSVQSQTTTPTEDISISGNVCRNNLTYGILVTNSGDGRVTGVQITNNRTIDNGSSGIHVSDAVTGEIAELMVVGNHSTGNTSNDIRVDPPDAVIEANCFDTTDGSLSYTFAAGDATPSVKGRNLFRTNNSAPTTITMFDDGRPGQRITVRILDANTTIDFTSTNLKGNAGSDWSPGNGDFMICTFDGTNWYCSVHDTTA